jgi:hypothetical protein
VHVELHFIVEDLNELLHGWEMTRLQLRPHRYIYKTYGTPKPIRVILQ